jgi:hypothetical protein
MTYDRPAGSAPAFSIPSILAIICAVLSFVTGGWGVFLAIAAIILGIIGVLLALSPRVRGGLMSIMSVVAGLLGIVVALFKVVF